MVKPGLRAAAALALLAAALCGALLWLRPPLRAEAEWLVFGSRARVELLSDSRERAEAALAAIGRRLAADHRAWHAWEPGPLTRLNAALAAGRSQRPSPDLVEMIREAQHGYVASDGLFNPAAGRLIGAWGFHTSDYPVRTPAPDAAQLAPLLSARPTMADIEITPDGRVESRNRAVALDLNGMAEGYAANQVRGLLAAHGIDDALVYIGGFVLALGSDDGQPWEVGVSAPDGVLGVLALRPGEALASSGDYQRHRADAPAQGHILDPRSGRPQRASAAASVLGRDPVMADIAATALMVAGPEGAQRLARRMRLGCVLLLGHDGTLYISPALRARLRPGPGEHYPLRLLDLPGTDC